MLDISHKRTSLVRLPTKKKGTRCRIIEVAGGIDQAPYCTDTAEKVAAAKSEVNSRHQFPDLTRAGNGCRWAYELGKVARRIASLSSIAKRNTPDPTWYRVGCSDLNECCHATRFAPVQRRKGGNRVLVSAGLSVGAIADAIGRHRSTVSREPKRNGLSDGRSSARRANGGCSDRALLRWRMSAVGHERPVWLKSLYVQTTSESRRSLTRPDFHCALFNCWPCGLLSALHNDPV